MRTVHVTHTRAGFSSVVFPNEYCEPHRHFDFGVILADILSHLYNKRKFRYPIQLAAIDGCGNMLLQTITLEDGVEMHYPAVPAGHALEMSLALPAHVLFVDCQGRSVKATILDTDTGEWLLG
jgi:hypothetical protein